MVKRRVRLVLIALIAAAVVASIVYADLAAGTKAPDFTLPTIDGKTFTLSSCFARPARVVLLDIWATWCPPCRAEIPRLIDLQKKFNGKDVLIVGVSVDQKKSDVVDFAKKQRINYTVAHDSGGDKVGRPYGVRSIPTTYIIDKKGVIRHAHTGFPPRDPQAGKEMAAQMEREIKTLLAQK